MLQVYVYVYNVRASIISKVLLVFLDDSKFNICQTFVPSPPPPPPPVFLSNLNTNVYMMVQPH